MRDSRTRQELADKEFSTATLWERRRRAVLSDMRFSPISDVSFPQAVT